MTAHAPHTPPPEAVAEALVRDLAETGALWSAVERVACSRASVEDLPWWVSALGPWTREEAQGRVWARWTRHRGRGQGYRAFEVCWAAGRWWASQPSGNRQGPFDVRDEAMAAADATAREDWVFAAGLPPEEPDPTPAPDPRPIAQGSGRRAGQHVWEELEVLGHGHYRREQWLCRCSHCGLWRGLRQYVQPYVPRERVVQLVREGQGLRKAGRCPGRRT